MFSATYNRKQIWASEDYEKGHGPKSGIRTPAHSVGKGFAAAWDSGFTRNVLP